MGQVSFPRLEKLTTAMSWESQLLYTKERWANTKLLIFFRLFSYKSLRKHDIKFLKIWKKKKINKLNFTIKNYVGGSDPVRNIIFNNYIHHFKNKYTSLVIYSNVKTGKKLVSFLGKRYDTTKKTFR